ncbi:MAG TPA: acylase [Ktedonobacteraceae bacterium]|jgi:acyl-homoserine-lactone acylase
MRAFFLQTRLPARSRLCLAICLPLLAIVFATCGLPAASTTQAQTTNHATIEWDSWGVPHIFAGSNQGLFYAFGYAQMHNHADLLLTLYGEARGRAAEYWGADYLSNDELVRTMGYPEHAQQWYRAQTPEFRSYIDAFVAGVNAYARAHPEQITERLKVMLPVLPTDVFAHGERVLGEFLLGDCGSAIADGLANAGTSGSNGWAIGPQHAAGGNALLLANPHLAWGDDNTFFEAQLHSPTVSVYGATLVGFPVLAIAFNQNLGWTHTVNTLDGCDRYALTLSGTGYLFDGRLRAFSTRTQTLLVRQPDNSMQTQQLIIRRAVQGPVFTLGKGPDTQTIAIRMVGVDQFPATGIWQQWWDMGRANNLSEFQAALQRLQIPMFTVIYADRAGNVLSLFNGEVPARAQGDWNFWRDVVPGDTSQTLWTSLLPYRSLPRVLNPPADWVQNSNSSPWYTTWPQQLDPQRFPPSLAPVTLSLREQQGIAMLRAQQSISLQQLVSDKFSTHVLLADRVLDALIGAASASGDSLAQQAAGVLASWDRSTDASSQGSALFYVWFQDMEQSNAPIFAHPWDATQPLTTPSGLADPQSAVADLDQAAQLLLSRVGRLDVSWGTVFRLVRGSENLPASGGPGDPFGIFRALYFTQGHNGFEADAGDSYIAAVQFSTPVRAQVLLTYGNASQPGSPHNGDQLALYAQNQLRPAWLSASDIQAHLSSRDELVVA